MSLARENAISAVGFAPGNATKMQQASLIERMQQASLIDQSSNDANLRRVIVAYLVTQGITQKSAQTATAHSLACAYCATAYMRSWRNRVNPSFALLGGTDDADEAEAKAKAEVNAAPTASPPAQTSVEPKMSEAWLKDLFVQINSTVEKLVQTKLDNTTLKLDDTAKAQIRNLAIGSAKDTVAELMPPRQVEVFDHTKGTVIPMGLVHEKFDLLLRAVQAKDHKGFRLNVWLTGPTGSGKTSACEGVAKALGLNFGSDGSLDADYKVLGFRDANGNIISTQFLDIYENGGVYVADEIDNWMPNALLSLNAALANGWVSAPKGMIKRHPDACVIACANTWGLGATNDYVGRTKLDAASLDRFQPKIEWPIDEKLERAVAQAQGESLGLDWHNTVVFARKATKRQGLKVIISPRATFSGIALLQAGFTQAEVIDMTIGAGLSPEQKSTLGLNQAKASPTVATRPFREYSPYSSTGD